MRIGVAHDGRSRDASHGETEIPRGHLFGQLRTAWTDEWDNPATLSPLGMPLQPILVDEALARIDHAAYRAGSGAEKLTNYYVGQIVGSMNTTKTSAQVVFDMIDEYIDSVRLLDHQLEA